MAGPTLLLEVSHEILGVCQEHCRSGSSLHPNPWDAVDLGNCPKRESLQKWLGEGAKGLFDSFWAQGAKVSQESLAPPKPSFAPVQPHFAPVQEASCSRGPKDLLHPLLTTFGDFPFSGNFPGLQLPKSRTPSLPIWVLEAGRGRNVFCEETWCPHWRGAARRRLKCIQCSVGVWKCLRSLPPDPQPQYWIKSLDPWMQDFYPVLGWGLAPV